MAARNCGWQVANTQRMRDEYFIGLVDSVSKDSHCEESLALFGLDLGQPVLVGLVGDSLVI